MVQIVVAYLGLCTPVGRGNALSGIKNRKLASLDGDAFEFGDLGSESVLDGEHLGGFANHSDFVACIPGPGKLRLGACALDSGVCIGNDGADRHHFSFGRVQCGLLGSLATYEENRKYQS